jgi:hypothetical protein
MNKTTVIIIIVVVLVIISIITAVVISSNAAAEKAAEEKAAEEKAAEEKATEARVEAARVEAARVEEARVEEARVEAEAAVFPYNTKNNSKGNGTIAYLDRHNIDCPSGKALNNFQHKNGSSGMSYGFGCLNKNISSPSGRATPPQLNGGYIWYLDRHKVACRNNELLTQLKVTSLPGRKIRYNFSCAPSKSKLSCRSVVNKKTSDNGRTPSLSNQNIKCREDEALSKFRYNRTDGKNMNYHYTCCK